MCLSLLLFKWVTVSAVLSPSWSVVKSLRGLRWEETMKGGREIRVTLCWSPMSFPNLGLPWECSYVQNPGKTSQTLVITIVVFMCLGSCPMFACGLKYILHTLSFLIFQSHYLADYPQRCRELMSHINSDWFKASATNLQNVRNHSLLRTFSEMIGWFLAVEIQKRRADSLKQKSPQSKRNK